MKQVLVIHGGNTYDTYEDYLKTLKSWKISLDDLRPYTDWKGNLANDLGPAFDVLSPKMPNKQNAKYVEWKIMFDKIIPLLSDGVVLIGHSMGGIFLAKYLSEQEFSKKVGATILVSAPFDNSDNNDSLADFVLPSSLEKFTQQSKEIYLIQSKDDPYVPISQFEKYKKAIPSARTLLLETGGHFRQEHFPEMVKLLKELV